MEEKREQQKGSFNQDLAEIYAQKHQQKTLDSNLHLIQACNAKQSTFHLDVGCGSGLACLALSKFSRPGISIYALDISSDMISLGFKRFRNSGFLANEKNTLYESYQVRKSKIFIEQQFQGTHMKLYVGSSAQLPFKDSSFDSYSSSLTFMHVKEEQWQKMLKQMFRVLKPGKKAAISVVGPRTNQFTWLNNVFKRNIDVGIEAALKVGEQPEKLKQQLLQIGFKSVKYWSVDSVDSCRSGEQAYNVHIQFLQQFYDLKYIDKDTMKQKIIQQYDKKFVEGDELLVFESIIFCIQK